MASVGQHIAGMAAGKPLTLADMVNHWAPQYGVDPVAALKVSSVEGGGKFGAVGDQGTSFGPWQLHIGGAMPAQYATPQAAAAFANSEAGVKYVLQQMGKVSGGLTGNAAIAAIVRRFERPAAPEAEIARAIGANAGGAAAFAPAGAGLAPPPYQFGLYPQQGLGAYAKAAANSLAAMRATVESLLAPSAGTDPAAAMLADTLARQQAAGAAQVKPMALLGGSPYMSALSSALGAPMGFPQAAGPQGRVSVSPGADRRGVALSPGIMDFASRVAGVFGQPLRITTGTNHNRFVAGTNRQSAHWTGNAADIAAAGSRLTQMGRAALVAAGMPAAQALQVKGGLFNVGPYQVIFNSNEGGNHYNHLHIGLRGGQG